LKQEIVSFSTSFQTGRGVQPASCKMGIGVLFLGRKVAEAWSWPYNLLEWKGSEESNDTSIYLLCLRGRLPGEFYTWWYCGFSTKYLHFWVYMKE